MASDSPAGVVAISGLSPVVQEASERYERTLTWESNARKRFLDDYKFANGDVYNGYQWPDGIKKDRDGDERPCLTINKVRQHCLQIINDVKKNKNGIIARATGGGATYESAQMISALIRHIEYTSRASTAYDTATEFQVMGGWGYIRVSTDYADAQSFNQKIMIERVKDPLCVYADPDAREVDKLDAKFYLVLDVLPKDQFEKKYPKWKDKANCMPLGGGTPFLTDEHIVVAEYWRKEEYKDVLYAIQGPTGPMYMRKSMLKVMHPDEKEFKTYIQGLDDDPGVRSREVVEEKVLWSLIVGQEEIDKKEWPGKYIPIVPVIGEETIIEGAMDRKGHVRSMIDPQRMYNYWSSAAVEYGALQGKQPWLAPVEAIEGYEKYYTSANIINHAWMPYKSIGKNGEPLSARPERIAPPVAAPLCITGMQIASGEFAMASGQEGPYMGEAGNERSGKAIFQREKQGDNATFHYADNRATALRAVGMILIDLIPHIYDTQQIMQIMNMEEQPVELMIDPKAQQSYEQKKNEQGVVAQHVLNPNVGTYEVHSDVGPNFSTRREEGFEAFKLIMTQNPQLTGIIGDIMLRAGDFPYAVEASQRLRRMVPAYALGEGPSPAEQQLQQQVQQLSGLLQQAMEDLSGANLKLKGKDQQRDIDVYGEFTKRLKVLLDAKLKAAQVGVQAASAAQPTPGGEGSPGVPGVSSDEIGAIMDDLLPDVTNVDIAGIVQANGSEQGSGGSGQAPVMPALHDMPGSRRDFAGRQFGRDFSGSHSYRPI